MFMEFSGVEKARELENRVFIQGLKEGRFKKKKCNLKECPEEMLKLRLHPYEIRKNRCIKFWPKISPLCVIYLMHCCPRWR